MLAGIGYSRRTVGKSLREWVFWSQSVVGCQHFHPAGSRHAIAEVSATVQTADGPSAATRVLTWAIRGLMVASGIGVVYGIVTVAVELFGNKSEEAAGKVDQLTEAEQRQQ